MNYETRVIDVAKIEKRVKKMKLHATGARCLCKSSNFFPLIAVHCLLLCCRVLLVLSSTTNLSLLSAAGSQDGPIESKTSGSYTFTVSKQVGDRKFPRLTDTIRANGEKLYMRSEVSMSTPLMGSTKRLYLMDEWLYKGDIRLKTYGLEKNLDLIIYGQTGESFDISQAYRCGTKDLPKLTYSDHIENSQLLLFWKDNKTLVESLLHLYYAPAALWRLAEKSSPENVRLMVDETYWLAGSTLGPPSDKYARQIGREVWRISSPPGSRQKTWSYDLHFERYARPESNGQREWFSLARIGLEEPEYAGAQRKVEIDVVNYDFGPEHRSGNDAPKKLPLNEQARRENSRMYREKLLLPEGYNCDRSQEVLKDMRQAYDDLRVDLNSDYWLSYEASLRLYDDDHKDKEASPLRAPSLGGSFFRSNNIALGTYVDLFAHYSRIRHVNGSVTASKLIYDSFRSLLFQIDRSTGQCELKWRPKSIWRLEFPDVRLLSNGKNGSEFVNLNEPLIDQLFTGTLEQGYKPINRYTTDSGRQVSIYERAYDRLDGSLVANINGPLTVIRRYESEPGAISKRTSATKVVTKLHRKVSVKVLMFDTCRTKLQASLAINLVRAANIRPTEIIRVANVAQCYNNNNNFGGKFSTGSSGSFVMEYPLALNLDSASLGERHINMIVQNFTKILLSVSKIQTTQLNGLPRVEMSHSKAYLRVHFNLLEAPTAIDYFRRWPGSTMKDEMILMAEVKLAANERECSTWCDQFDCVAMTYCLDRTCRLITRNTVRNQEPGKQVGIESCVPSGWCTYYYLGSPRPITLEAFANSMKLTVNDGYEPDELARLGLVLDGETSSAPSHFYELENEFQDLLEDTGNSLRSPDSSSSSSMETLYKVYKQEYRLNTALLKDSEGEITTSIKQARSMTHCLEFCQTTANCMAVSYCPMGESLCQLISSTKSALDLKRQLVPALERASQPQCEVLSRDFLVQYTRFENTRQPSTSQVELANYSAIECAAACEVRAPKESSSVGDGDRGGIRSQDEGADFICLSFDSCLSAGNRVCYLQKMHLMMDAFDRSILDPKSHSKGVNGNGQTTSCDHYSRSTLADFRRIPNRELQKKGHELSLILRGYTAERCALECQLEDDCKAFEHCFNDQLHPAQSCYFIRSNELPAAESDWQWNENLERALIKSKYCSIYKLKHFSEQYRPEISGDSSSSSDVTEMMAFEVVSDVLKDQHGGFWNYLILVACLMLASITVGTVIRILHIRLKL